MGFVLSNRGFCQTGSLATQGDSIKSVKRSFGKVASSFLSNNIYLGRKNDAVQSYITTGVGYYHKSGLYISAAASYIPNKGFQRFDMKELSVGYEYNGEKFNGAANVVKYFYGDSSSTINSAINTMIGLAANYDFKIFTLGTTVDFNFVSKTDAVLNVSLSYPFYLSNDKLGITPALNLYAGSQNFYQAYYQPSKSGGGSPASRGKGRSRSGSGNNSGTVQILDYNKFKIMDYELSLPIEYTVKHVTFNLKPVYIIPVNPSTFVENNVIVKEDITNSFIIEVGVSYKF